ncbi:MAG: transposase [Limisphaerales bacterium]
MSYVSSYHHCVFSTKERRPLIIPALRERLWPFLGGIARQNKMKAIEVGGVADHVHLLLSLPTTMPIAKAMQLIKAVRPNGCMKHFPNTVSLRGRKNMAHSASANRVSNPSSNTSKARKNTIGR